MSKIMYTDGSISMDNDGRVQLNFMYKNQLDEHFICDAEPDVYL